MDDKGLLVTDVKTEAIVACSTTGGTAALKMIFPALHISLLP